MRYLKEYNNQTQVLRDLIGDVKSETKKGYRTISETTKGCFTDIDFQDDYDNINWLDSEFKIQTYGDSNIGEIILKHPDVRYSKYLNIYLDDGFPKIISGHPGDERGCHLFGDVFISSGHDGNYLWNVKTGEFDSFTW